MVRRFAWIVTINIIVLRCEEFFRLGDFIKGAVKSMPKFGTIYLHYKGNKYKYLKLRRPLRPVIPDKIKVSA